MKKKAPKHIFSLRVIVGLVIVLTEIVFLNYFLSAEIEFVLSSAVVTVALLIQLRFGMREDASTPADMVVFIFNWLFLDMSPKIQLLGMPQQLVNTSSVAVDRVAVTNLVCAVFILAFTGCYQWLSAQSRDRAGEGGGTEETEEPPPFTAAAIGVAVFFCIVTVGLAAPHAYRTADAAAVSPAELIAGRFLLFIPSATLLILLNETVRSGRKLVFSRLCVIALLMLLVLVTENPLTEKRNALGPVYIGILLVAFQGWFAKRSRILMLLVLSMVVVFPVSSLFTHNHQQTLGALSMSQVWDEIELHYFSINYDSWANIYTSVEIVKVHGLQWGHQLLGSILFFVPSSIWTAKPLATGIFLADYLIANYSMWFTNLSAPLAAEGYLDFGFAGVVAYAAGLAVFVAFLNRFARRRDKWIAMPMAMYTSVFLMIVMRGSLMIAMGFAGAAFLSFYAASGLLSLKLGMRKRHASARRTPARTTVATGS
jgi:hypothetical protein